MSKAFSRDGSLGLMSPGIGESRKGSPNRCVRLATSSAVCDAIERISSGDRGDQISGTHVSREDKASAKGVSVYTRNQDDSEASIGLGTRMTGNLAGCGKTASSRSKCSGADHQVKDDGLSFRLYYSNVQSVSGGAKLPYLRARTNGCDVVILSETNKREGDEGSITVGCKVARVSNTPNPDRTGPGFGTFIGLKLMDPDRGEFITIHDHFELVLTRKCISGAKIVVLGWYRSPSMQSAEMDLFYEEARKMIEDYASDADVLLVGGDDNSHDEQGSCTLARRAFRKLEDLRLNIDAVHIVDEKTRSTHQTDHMLARFDPLLWDVTAVVCPGVGDHCEIVVTVQNEQLAAEKPKWQRRTVTVDEGNPELIEIDLRDRLASLSINGVDSYPFINQSVIDDMVKSFHDGVELVRARHRVTRTRNFPTGPGPMKGKEHRELQFCLNKLLALYKKLRDHPDRDDAVKIKSDIVLWKSKHTAAAEAAGRVVLEKDMAMMRKNQRVNPARFFQGTGMQIKSDQLDIVYSAEEQAMKLEKAEENYYLKGPKLDRSQFEDIVPDAQFVIPYSEEVILEEFKKLKKVDSFYKRFKYALTPALSAIAYAMSKSSLFPSECKIMKLCFLKSRTIFSADFLTKLLEGLVIRGLDEVMPEETLGQFAYQPGRSTLLCVAFGLNEAEKVDDLAFSFSADQKKAFDSARHATICQVMQKEAGAGEFTYQYFSGRNYRFKGELGFKNQPQGRGTPPGSRLGPKQFGKFQGTDLAITFLNEAWLSPGAFSDDKAPIAVWARVLDGSVSRALESTWKWSQENFVDYHLVGKKKPEYYIFRKAGVSTSTQLPFELKLGPCVIERKYEMVQLGIFVRFFEDHEVANKHGYYLDWKSTKTQFSRMAYRLQDVRHMWSPQMRWRMCKVYILGKLQYGSCLYWLRADAEKIAEIRFYYCMSMASVMGMTAPELLGMWPCRKQKVKANNVGYLRAVEFLNLPTLKDLAIDSAKALLRQWKTFRPEQFMFGEDDDDEIISTADGESVLLKELLSLSKQKKNDWYPAFNAAKGPARSAENFEDDELPLWRRFWAEVGKAIEDGSVSKSTSLLNGTFMRMCQNEFKVLEPVVRVTKKVSLAVTKPTKRTGDALDSSKQKKRKVDGMPPLVRRRLDCLVPRPIVKGSKRRPCRICGYVINDLTDKEKASGVVNSVSFVCCRKEAHIACWQAARKSTDSCVKCSELKHLLKKDRATPLAVPVEVKAAPEENFALCKYCGDLVSLVEGKDHLESACKIAASSRSKTGASRIRKLADRCVALTARCISHPVRNRKNPNMRLGAEPPSKRRAVSADDSIT